MLIYHQVAQSDEMGGLEVDMLVFNQLHRHQPLLQAFPFSFSLISFLHHSYPCLAGMIRIFCITNENFAAERIGFTGI